MAEILKITDATQKPEQSGNEELIGGMTDAQWLNVVRSELERSIGFRDNGDIENQRKKALKAFYGDSQVPHIEGRSKANDTSVSDAINTVLPDLMEIFTGGEDVATFDPIGEEDVEAARQETEAVTHIVYEQNDGVEVVRDYLWNALVAKTGVFKVRNVTKTDTHKRYVDGDKELADTMAAMGDNVQWDEQNQRIEIIENIERKIVSVESVPSEDFAVAEGTVRLREATYCVQRSRVRAQDLVREGHDPALVKRLDVIDDDEVADARDTVEEDYDGDGGSRMDMLRFVTVYEHYIRLRDESGDKVYQVISDRNCSVLLDVDEVDVMPYAAGTPFPIPHRFYGLSLADMLIEIQRIQTSLLRLMLDEGSFALNQSFEVAANKVTKDTISKFMDNRPGRLIPTKDGMALRALQSAGLSYDVMGAMEHMATLGERRGGVVRNAQGLNPDTLHDTALGAQILMDASQKRVKQIARNLAEGIKDMYWLVHRFARANGEQLNMRLNGEYVPIDPSTWVFRHDAKLKIGVGSSGRQTKIAALTNVIDRQAQAMEGGLTSLVTEDNVYRAVIDLTKAAGIDGESYFSDPAMAEPQEPQPDPEVMKVQAEQQAKQAEMQNKMALSQAEAQAKMQLEQAKAQAEIELQRFKAQQEAELAREKMALEARLAAMRGVESDLPANRAGGSLLA